MDVLPKGTSRRSAIIYRDGKSTAAVDLGLPGS